MDTKNCVQEGLVGFFDILGYKSLIENNSIHEMVIIVKTIQEIVDSHQKILEEWASECGHVMFSDSILVYAPLSDPQTEHKNSGLVAEFCAGILNDLFWGGLPVRGAWAFGEFYVELKPGKICLAGMPIVEAYECTNALDLAGCVVTRSAEKVLIEKQILDSSSERPLGFMKYLVPLKSGRKELFMLDHYAFDRHNHRHPRISRQTVLEKFGAHKKTLNASVLTKVNNTLEFLNMSHCE
jgi:hypothetical protein